MGSELWRLVPTFRNILYALHLIIHVTWLKESKIKGWVGANYNRPSSKLVCLSASGAVCLSIFVVSTALQAKLQPDSGPGNDKATWQRGKWRRAERRGNEWEKLRRNWRKWKVAWVRLAVCHTCKHTGFLLPPCHITVTRHDLIMCSEETSHTILQHHVHLEVSSITQHLLKHLYKQLAWALYLICTHVVL